MSNDAIISFQAADANSDKAGAVAASSLSVTNVVVGDKDAYFDSAPAAFTADDTAFCLKIDVATSTQDKT